jgi:hypothetical protein
MSRAFLICPKFRIYANAAYEEQLISSSLYETIVADSGRRMQVAEVKMGAVWGANGRRKAAFRAAVIHPGRLDLDDACSQGQYALPTLAIAHSQGVSSFVTQMAKLFDVLISVKLKGFCYHPPCTLASQLIQALSNFRRCSFSIIRDKFIHGGFFPWYLSALDLRTRRIHPLSFSCQSTTFGYNHSMSVFRLSNRHLIDTPNYPDKI